MGGHVVCPDSPTQAFCVQPQPMPRHKSPPARKGQATQQKGLLPLREQATFQAWLLGSPALGELWATSSFLVL